MSRTIARNHGRLVRLVAMVLIALYERRVNTLRSEVEERSHSTAFANLDAKQRRQVGFTALMVVVFGLGAAGMAASGTSCGAPGSRSTTAWPTPTGTAGCSWRVTPPTSTAPRAAKA